MRLDIGDFNGVFWYVTWFIKFYKPTTKNWVEPPPGDMSGFNGWCRSYQQKLEFSLFQPTKIVSDCSNHEILRIYQQKWMYQVFTNTKMVLKHKTDACSNQHQATLAITKQMAAQSSNIDDLANNDGSLAQKYWPKYQRFKCMVLTRDSWLTLDCLQVHPQAIIVGTPWKNLPFLINFGMVFFGFKKAYHIIYLVHLVTFDDFCCQVYPSVSFSSGIPKLNGKS